MAFSLRLPPALDDAARIRAEQIGVPLNALVCFALDQYLRGCPSGSPAAPLIDALDQVNPRRLSRGGMPLKVRSAEGLGAKFGERPSKAVLELNDVPPDAPKQLSKAERREITSRLRLERKQGNK